MDNSKPLFSEFLAEYQFKKQLPPNTKKLYQSAFNNEEAELISSLTDKWDNNVSSNPKTFTGTLTVGDTICGVECKRNAIVSINRFKDRVRTRVDFFGDQGDNFNMSKSTGREEIDVTPENTAHLGRCLSRDLKSLLGTR